MIWDKLMFAPQIMRILINNTGDMFIHPQRDELFDYMERNKRKAIIMTTNAAEMDRVPKIHEMVISFNGFDKESYEYTTRLPFDETVAKIRSFYPEIKENLQNAEIHCLAWADTYVDNIEDRVRDLWGDFPGRVRVSYKYDNQHAEDLTVAAYKQTDRIMCEYLETLSILPNGDVNMCAHDFGGEYIWGNALTDSIYSLIVHGERMKQIARHKSGDFMGLCASCNFNTTTSGRVVYVKG